MVLSLLEMEIVCCLENWKGITQVCLLASLVCFSDCILFDRVLEATYLKWFKVKSLKIDLETVGGIVAY